MHRLGTFGQKLLAEVIRLCAGSGRKETGHRRGR